MTPSTSHAEQHATFSLNDATREGRTLLIGNCKLMSDQGIDTLQLEGQAATLAEQGKTPMFVAIDGQAAGLVAVADTIKPTAKEATRRFKELGIEAVMITGDNARTAAVVAKALGIDAIIAYILRDLVAQLDQSMR